MAPAAFSGTRGGAGERWEKLESCPIEGDHPDEGKDLLGGLGLQVDDGEHSAIDSGRDDGRWVGRGSSNRVGRRARRVHETHLRFRHHGPPERQEGRGLGARRVERPQGGESKSATVGTRRLAWLVSVHGPRGWRARWRAVGPAVPGGQGRSILFRFFFFFFSFLM